MNRKTRGAIAAGHPKTAEAGQIILELGGNAFDAAIAAMLASFVVESTLTSAGGGGFLLAHTQDQESILFDFFCQTPQLKKSLSEIEFYPVDINFGGATQVFHIGRGSVAVPGSLMGLFTVHQELGQLPFSVLVEPAMNYARNGYQVNDYNRVTFEVLEPILRASHESRKIYLSNNELFNIGDIAYIKDFANILEEFAKKGIQEFYQGDIGQQILQDMKEGGYLTQEDLDNYRVIKRKPLNFNYRGYQLLTNPPPSSGGILINYALKILENINLKSYQFGSQDYLQLLALVMNLTNDSREINYDNYLYQDDIISQFLSKKNISDGQNKLQQTINKWGSTTHISVMDEYGNAASVTNSNGEGSSYVIPNTGIMLNNMLGEADLNPLGFHCWPNNCRISSMMSPTIILQEGKPKIVLGSGGSNRIRTVLLQVIFNLLDFNFSLEEAINKPRVHWENNLFNLEPTKQLETIENLRLPPDTEIILWQELNMFFGGVHAVRLKEDNSLEAIGDPRRSGVGIIC